MLISHLHANICICVACRIKVIGCHYVQPACMLASVLEELCSMRLRWKRTLHGCSFAVVCSSFCHCYLLFCCCPKGPYYCIVFPPSAHGPLVPRPYIYLHITFTFTLFTALHMPAHCDCTRTPVSSVVHLVIEFGSYFSSCFIWFLSRRYF